MTIDDLLVELEESERRFWPEGISPRPLLQFLVEVEELLLANDLI